MRTNGRAIDSPSKPKRLIQCIRWHLLTNHRQFIWIHYVYHTDNEASFNTLEYSNVEKIAVINPKAGFFKKILRILKQINMIRLFSLSWLWRLKLKYKEEITNNKNDEVAFLTMNYLTDPNQKNNEIWSYMNCRKENQKYKFQLLYTVIYCIISVLSGEKKSQRNSFDF